MRLLRRVKNLLPWILFKVCLPFRWAKCKVCENFWRIKRFKIGSNSFIFQKMMRCSLWSIRHTSCNFMLVSFYFWRVGKSGEPCGDQCDIITRSCDLFYWPYILIVSSGCVYLFDYIIASSYVLLKLVCVAHFDVWTLALSRVISMMTTDLLLFIIWKKSSEAPLIKIKRGNLLKSNQNISLKQSDPARHVFVCLCSGVLLLLQLRLIFGCFISFKTSPVFIRVIRVPHLSAP